MTTILNKPRSAARRRKPLQNPAGRAIHRIRCAEIWGGIADNDQDLCTAGITASLFSSAADGGRGGDIYYFSVCSSDSLTRIALADVMGHGEHVSALSGAMYDSLAARMNTLEGDGVLRDLNEFALAQGFHAITTAAVVGYYKSDGNLYSSCAGHHPVLLQRKGERHWRPAEPLDEPHNANLPLGVLPDVVYAQQVTPLRPGDRLFLYTDGLIEAPNAGGDLFTAERLIETLDESAAADLMTLKQRILARLRAHTGGSLAHDDVTFVAIEVH